MKKKLTENTIYFRTKLEKLGYTLGGGNSPFPKGSTRVGEGEGFYHPITPIMIFDEVKTMALADELLKEGLYVRGFAYPVVPKGKGRIRVQISAAHTKKQLDKAIEALERAGRKLGIIK